MNHERRSQPQVTLEDLFRLKRAERPPEEFWTQFDRDMRVKQLAAIVEPRPWWAPLIRVGSRVSRYQLPVGATAILALTLVTVSQYRLPQSGEASFVPAVAQNTLDAMPGPALSAPVAANVYEQHASVSAEASASTAAVAATEQPRTLDALPGQTLVASLPAAEGAEMKRNEFSPSARSIEATLAAVKATEPELARLMDSMPGIGNRTVAVAPAPAVDPLAHMQSPSESRRARLLASVLPTSSYNSSERRTTARVDRDLTDERLYESISRFGVQGSKLAIKF